METENTVTDATPENDLIIAALGDDEPAEAETKPEEPAKETDAPAEQEVDKQEEETTEEASEETEQPEKTEDKQELDPEEARKEEARRRYEERERVRAERLERVKKQTQQYVDEAGDDETEKRLRAMEVQNYNAIIEQTEDKLITEFERVKANPELQIFNPESESFNQKIYDKAMRDFNAGYIQYDENGNMVGLKGSLYTHLTETAELYSGAIKTGQIKQARDQRTMGIKADTKPAAQPKEQPKDSLMETLTSDD